MDLVGYSQDVFNNISDNIKNFLKTIKLQINHIIPISALNGDNITSCSDNMPWYNGENVLQVLNNMNVNKEDIHKSLIFPVQDVYKVNDKRIAVGKLETGMIKENMEVVVYPTKQKTNIKSIEKFMEDAKVSVAGESIGITTKAPVFIERGSIICSNGEEMDIVKSFKASVFWMSKSGLHTSEKVLLKCTTQETTCEIECILRKADSSSLNFIDNDMDTLNNLDVGEVIIRLKKPIVLARFKDIKALGRFVLVKDNDICAGGIVTEIIEG